MPAVLLPFCSLLGQRPAGVLAGRAPSRAGRTVRGTVRSNPKRSYLDSFRLFWKSREKSTRGFGPLDSGDSSGLLGSCIVSHSGANHAAACNCFCVWLLRFGFCGGSCSTFEAALPLASPCQGEGDRRRRWKGGYVAESDIVTTGDMTYCFLYAAIERYATSPPPSQLR